MMRTVNSVSSRVMNSRHHEDQRKMYSDYKDKRLETGNFPQVTPAQDRDEDSGPRTPHLHMEHGRDVRDDVRADSRQHTESDL